MRRLEKLIRDNPEMDDAQIRQCYNSEPNAPTLRLGVVAAMRKAIAEDRIR